MTIDDDNDSTRKFEIQRHDKEDGSQWIKCVFLKWGTPNPIWIPSLRDLHRIIQAISECEDLKYPPPARGRRQLLPFLYDCVRTADWDAVARKYKIPDRDRGRVIKTNGARIAVALEPMTAADIKW